ncbi:MAG: hypothetical protein LC791_02445, partial [Acidobacteria bacterium]|nr:hypothetical protein [Acidobacteriota bacterium]
VDPRLADAVLGDLNELFGPEAALSPWRAYIGYWCRTAGAIWHLSRRRHPRSVRVAQGDRTMVKMWKDFIHGLRLFVIDGQRRTIV